jgi:hypothetical protein
MRQKRRLEGSFTNYLMGNNSSVPEAGKGATMLMYSDRYPSEVLEVSRDGKRCVIRAMNHKGIGKDMGHQDWNITPDPSAPKQTLVYRNGAWRKECLMVVFNDDWYNSFATREELWDAQKRLNVWDDRGELRVISGVTKVKRSYDKVNILFGVAEYHYDWEF